MDDRILLQINQASWSHLLITHTYTPHSFNLSLLKNFHDLINLIKSRWLNLDRTWFTRCFYTWRGGYTHTHTQTGNDLAETCSSHLLIFFNTTPCFCFCLVIDGNFVQRDVMPTCVQLKSLRDYICVHFKEINDFCISFQVLLSTLNVYIQNEWFISWFLNLWEFLCISFIFKISSPYQTRILVSNFMMKVIIVHVSPNH